MMHAPKPTLRNESTTPLNTFDENIQPSLCDIVLSKVSHLWSFIRYSCTPIALVDTNKRLGKNTRNALKNEGQ